MTTESVMTHVEVNCTTGEVIERPYTPEEISAREAEVTANIAAQEERDLAEQAIAAAKASAEAKLTALGLTPEEIAALR